ncbi:hypothetical protein K533_10825 [Salmonella enterica subsp. enterica serovar Cubana str. CVM42234]|uniref:Uncharacterized protein n=1 Tax=Salmonella paratyphi B (strain ATCC BAA-1250 / SPB7) TaxID=1016998 RepID=A0A6C6YZT8_SALPB|nr:hypothetical protein SPAB_01415 [Salmonella enterica subsp. enterica serovar Paratyphi B str. SPB7]AGQ75472.1 hypothetical protein CFSAN002050_15495 [Salmonella enterica subsp. enterica serovar Cubana str. CFSAN002050]AGX13195.1 hypothetical protein IA1_08955 [Salmonella enterica subsp. enterica serovar Thompson str. RM6836]ESG89533.1 hypothetical protein SEEI1959_19157 [Salmonella enterica subsp. enterica serovar Indiana str. ATCC 51959]ESV51140.1 hypothetical protein K533_10825 [Salmonella
MLKNDLIVKTFLCDFLHIERQKNGYWHHFMLYSHAA